MKTIKFKNGVLDTETMEFVENGSHSIFHNMEVPFDYDLNAECPIWDKFIREAISNTEYLDKFVSFIKMTLSGKRKRKGLVLTGSGMGKTVISDVLKSIFTYNYNLCNITNFIDVRTGLIGLNNLSVLYSSTVIFDDCRPTDVESYEFMRLVNNCPQLYVSNDNKNRALLTENLPYFIAICNNINLDKLSRNITVIPFNYIPKDMDYNLTEKLYEERQGILNWIIDYK